MTKQLKLIACGDLKSARGVAPTQLQEILGHIGSSIDVIVGQLQWVGAQPPARLALFGPFLGRSLLELCLTAIAGRLDPIRLLVIREVQSRPDYTTEKAWKSSIHWQGDIMPRKAAAEPSKKKLDPDPWDVSRALLSDEYDRLLWGPATERLLAEASGSGSNWLAKIAGTGSDSFAGRKRSEMDRIYSSLSKGIHHEFVLPPGVLYDRTTVADLVQKVIQTVAEIGLVSHFVPDVPFAWQATKALRLFSEVEEMELIK